MQRLAMIAVTGFLTLLLSACSDDKDTSKSAELKTNNILEQTNKKLDKAAETNKINLEKGIETGESGSDQN